MKTQLVRRWNTSLRRELAVLAAEYANDVGVASYRSKGKQSMTLFSTSQDGLTHGNFITESFQSIKENPSWERRLSKSHSQRRALPGTHKNSANELDSSASSDALLMNVFCYPGFVNEEIAGLFGVSPGSVPEFGISANIALLNGRTDATEIDMRLGSTQVEAKLTEDSFTSATRESLDRYARFTEVFDVSRIPRKGEAFLSYQLIRNVLSVASKPGAHFVVILDARRPDLMREWWTIHTAIRECELRERCGFVTWQELAAAAPKRLRRFLEQKYGL